MTRRQLNEEEKKFITANLEIIESDRQYLEALIKQKSVAIEIAPVIYENQLSGMKKELVKLENDVEELKKTVEILHDQMENGVEAKHNNESEKDKETNE